MGTLRKRRGRGLNTRGGSMAYVILLVALLSVFSCGYGAMWAYNMKTAEAGGDYMEAQLRAKTIHVSFCESVAGGNSPAMNCLWEVFEEDVRLVEEEYDQMAEAENGEPGAAAPAAFRQDGDNTVVKEPFDEYLRQALGHKEYVISGVSDDGDGEELQVEITLKAEPLEERAHVHTRVRYKGCRFSLKADIVFDNSDRGFMTQDTGTSKTTAYLEGNGVYRYYEDKDYASP